MDALTSGILLFEFDTPTDRNQWLNYESGIWFWTISPGVVVVTDDNANTGYYDWTNNARYIVKSVRVDDRNYSMAESLADCRATNESFFYDPDTTNLYVHFNNFDPPIYEQGIFIGVSTGYTLGIPDSSFFYGDAYYEPRLTDVSRTKQSKDPLFFGLLKYQSGSARLINTDGHFDAWRARNLYGQAARILYGQASDPYANFETIFSGFIENDDRTWEEFGVTLQDPRKGLTQPVARNLLNQSDWPDLSDSNVDKPKPVAYGKIYNAESICLNEDETGSPTHYTFLICDTEFNNVTSLDAVYVNGVAKTAASTDLTAGTFTLATADVGGNFDGVTIDFTMPIVNGVGIITDLMTNYGNLPQVASFWDLAEVATAQAVARDTSLYVDDEKKLSDAIESVCYDIDAVFFNKHAGKYTIRIYDANRTPLQNDNGTDRILRFDEWIGDPKINNNGSEFLTSAVIGYKYDRGNDSYTLYEDTSYEVDAFSTYKRYKKARFDTGLYTLTDAQEKADTILTFSSNVQDIITRKTKFQNRDIEVMDFVVCDPVRRFSESDTYAVYEVLGVSLNYMDSTVDLTLRYVKAYTPSVTTYSLRITSTGDYRITSDSSTRITGE